MKTDMKKGEIIDFLDYKIKCCENNDGIVLYKDDVEHENLWETHLGNYGTKESAMQAAVMYFMISRPNIFHAQIFFRCMGRNGSMHEYFTLKETLKKENIKMPEEIGHTDDMNMLIALNGKLINWNESEPLDERQKELYPKMLNFCKNMATRYCNSEWIAKEANEIIKSATRKQ